MTCPRCPSLESAMRVIRDAADAALGAAPAPAPSPTPVPAGYEEVESGFVDEAVVVNRHGTDGWVHPKFYGVVSIEAMRRDGDRFARPKAVAPPPVPAPVPCGYEEVFEGVADRTMMAWGGLSWQPVIGFAGQSIEKYREFGYCFARPVRAASAAEKPVEKPSSPPPPEGWVEFFPEKGEVLPRDAKCLWSDAKDGTWASTFFGEFADPENFRYARRAGGAR